MAHATDRTEGALSGLTEFERFFADSEPRLRRALVAALGPDRGAEATAEALAWAFEHQDRLNGIGHQLRYLYRVGVSRTRPRRMRLPWRSPGEAPAYDVEPELWAALMKLTISQRTAVVLIDGFGWHLSEVAELLSQSVSTVNTHHRRGLSRLRALLGDPGS